MNHILQESNITYFIGAIIGVQVLYWLDKWKYFAVGNNLPATIQPPSPFLSTQVGDIFISCHMPVEPVDEE